MRARHKHKRSARRTCAARDRAESVCDRVFFVCFVSHGCVIVLGNVCDDGATKLNGSVEKQTNPAEAVVVSRGVLLHHHHQSDFHQKQAERGKVNKRKIHDKCPLFIAKNRHLCVRVSVCGVENYHKSQISRKFLSEEESVRVCVINVENLKRLV